MFDEYKPIDTDTHLTEPKDVWTSRVSKKWGDAVPHVKRVDGQDLWFIRDEVVGAPGPYTMAGYDNSIPDVRKTYEELPASAYDGSERLKMMDKEGIYGAVLYPNIGGFGSQGFLKLKEPELMIECVQAYNNFVTDWCAPDPKRLLASTAIPFWDFEATLKEIERTAKMGHKTILACTRPTDFGLPPMSHSYWDRFWAAIQDTGLPVSFHIGSGDMNDAIIDKAKMGTRAHLASFATNLFIANAQCINEVIFGGVCHRFPNLKLFSVESGIGWIPSFLETCDWQFLNGDVRREHPEYDLLPSEYFRRQIYASFWFESKNSGIDNAIDLYPDNIMWETDYPHPTSQYPALKKGRAQHPRDYANEKLGHISEDKLRKIFHTTPAKVFNLG